MHGGFSAETSVLKILNHDNVIKYIDTIETKSTLYIITELVSDGDLFDYVIQNEFLEGTSTSLASG